MYSIGYILKEDFDNNINSGLDIVERFEKVFDSTNRAYELSKLDDTKIYMSVLDSEEVTKETTVIIVHAGIISFLNVEYIKGILNET